MSTAEAVSVLFFDEMKWDPADASAQNVDMFILSKGHAAPILWAALFEAGAITEDPLTLRKFDSTLEGHPTFRNPWSRVATGSLGQGICAAVGVALARKVEKSPARTYCMLGDGECAEGSVWEAVQLASWYKLDNLCVMVDVNRLGQSGPTMVQHDMDTYQKRFEAFGMTVVVCDGHDVPEIQAALDTAKNTKDVPTCILLKTFKGKGVSFLEDKDGKHGKPCVGDELEAALKELGDCEVQITVENRRYEGEPPSFGCDASLTPDYNKGDKVATRAAYGKALAKLGQASSKVVALDAEVQGSTNANGFAKACPDRFFEAFIAEQLMVGAALGFGVAGMVPFASTFSCFLTRAYDFARMGVLTGPQHMVLCGSHGGVSVGEDGPSQMGLEDIAMMRALANTTVLHPCDAVSTEKCVATAANTTGIVYLRTQRPAVPVIYAPDEEFPVGGSKVLKSSGADTLTIVAAGVCVHEALKAVEALGGSVAVRVIDLYCIKPIDSASLIAAAKETSQIITVEDHSVCGGVGEAVASAVASTGCPVKLLGVTGVARSGSGAELMAWAGIDADGITDAIKEVTGSA
jgi:transketolase